MKKALFVLGTVLSLACVAKADDDIVVLQAQARNGDIEAATRLGKHFFDIEKKVGQAEFWFKAAADAGNAEAIYYLARIYDTAGNHSNSEIVALLEKSAGLGYAPAQTMLGRIYQFGRKGIARDLQKARMWYEMAAAKGANEAMAQLDVIYQHTGNEATKAALANENVEWLELGARQGNAEAALNLAKMAETGNGVPRDYKRAAELYKTAAEAGIVQAQGALGKLYANGQGVAQDVELAVFWLKKAAEEGYVEAQRKLVSVYTYQSPDIPAAYAWQIIALSSLFPTAQDLVAVSPDLERLMRSMTADEIKQGDALAVSFVEKIKENKAKREAERQQQAKRVRDWQNGL